MENNASYYAASGPFWLLDAVVDTIVGIALVGELVAVIANVVGRTFFDFPLLWTDEVASLALTTIAFIGGAIAYRRDQHIAVRTIVDTLPPGPRQIAYAAADWLVLEVAVISGYYSLSLLKTRWDELTPILELRGTWLALPLTVGMAVMIAYALLRLSQQTKHAVAISGIGLAALTILVVLVHVFWLPAMTAGVAIAIALGVVLVSVLLGLPVGLRSSWRPLSTCMRRTRLISSHCRKT
jgi:TRAP-type C4-dicarboxylate transport system permease small subunit